MKPKFFDLDGALHFIIVACVAFLLIWGISCCGVKNTRINFTGSNGFFMGLDLKHMNYATFNNREAIIVFPHVRYFIYATAMDAGTREKLEKTPSVTYCHKVTPEVLKKFNGFISGGKENERICIPTPAHVIVVRTENLYSWGGIVNRIVTLIFRDTSRLTLITDPNIPSVSAPGFLSRRISKEQGNRLHKWLTRSDKSHLEHKDDFPPKRREHPEVREPREGEGKI